MVEGVRDRLKSLVRIGVLHRFFPATMVPPPRRPPHTLFPGRAENAAASPRARPGRSGVTACRCGVSRSSIYRKPAEVSDPVCDHGANRSAYHGPALITARAGHSGVAGDPRPCGPPQTGGPPPQPDAAHRAGGDLPRPEIRARQQRRPKFYRTSSADHDTTCFHHPHLAMARREEVFVDRDAVPWGVLAFRALRTRLFAACLSRTARLEDPRSVRARGVDASDFSALGGKLKNVFGTDLQIRCGRARFSHGLSPCCSADNILGSCDATAGPFTRPGSSDCHPCGHRYFDEIPAIIHRWRKTSCRNFGDDIL